MHANEQLIRDFYAAFAKRDAVNMAACYHTDIAFSDPAFPMLRGKEATAMWAMLCSRGTDGETGPRPGHGHLGPRPPGRRH